MGKAVIGQHINDDRGVFCGGGGIGYDVGGRGHADIDAAAFRCAGCRRGGVGKGRYGAVKVRVWCEYQFAIQ